MSNAVVPSENDEAKAFHQWLEIKHYRHTHIMNESGAGYKNLRRSVLGKAMGVSRGVPDFMVIADGNLIFVELKRQHGGRIQPEQEQWLADLAKTGASCAICKGWQAAADFIEQVVHGDYKAPADGFAVLPTTTRKRRKSDDRIF